MPSEYMTKRKKTKNLKRNTEKTAGIEMDKKTNKP